MKDLEAKLAEVIEKTIYEMPAAKRLYPDFYAEELAAVVMALIEKETES